jgi:hypothetical protein
MEYAVGEIGGKLKIDEVRGNVCIVRLEGS